MREDLSRITWYNLAGQPHLFLQQFLLVVTLQFLAVLAKIAAGICRADQHDWMTIICVHHVCTSMQVSSVILLYMPLLSLPVCNRRCGSPRRKPEWKRLWHLQTLPKFRSCEGNQGSAGEWSHPYQLYWPSQCREKHTTECHYWWQVSYVLGYQNVCHKMSDPPVPTWAHFSHDCPFCSAKMVSLYCK